ncbi:uncharacterized protein [Haliotis cracherodii]|uniref:uncharacterized protein n=1 Tax=Haliotis cracherodii TaxID=6455 RepID=UPI0039E9AAB8
MDHHLSLVLALAIVVSVNAQRPSTILVRIVGTSATYGRVEVRNNATAPWGTVCSDYWGNKDATVTCRMLGYRWGTALYNYGGGSGMIYMDNVHCTGNENTLASCPYAGWANHNCRSHNRDAGVSCSNDNFRLVGNTLVSGYRAPSTSFGAVQYRDPTGWKPVCDSSWDDRDAQVLCRSLGYRDGSALCCSQLSPYTRNPYLYTRRSRTNFNCSGNEASIFNCTNQLRNTDCSYKRLASAICYSQPKGEVEMGFSLRLVNGTDVSGQVEVTKLGVAGKICASNWNVNASNVVCKQLGFRGGVTFGTTSARTDLPVWITSVNCTGQETSLDQCVSSVWGVPRGSCYPANVLCYNNGPPQLSLAGGDSSHGRVEITFDGETGTVCDNSFTNGDARVVCQTLGFKDGNYLTGSYYGRGSGPIFMDSLYCGGYEQTLWSCRNRGWRNPASSCVDHSKDASVTCFNELRLYRGDHGHGVVLIWRQFGRYSSWQPLCGTGFDDTAAKVVCRELGFQNGRALPRGSYGTYYYSTYLGSNITCTGNEASIRNCTLGSGTCSRQGYTGYASVSCYNGTLNTDTSIKLTGGPDQYSSVTGHVAVKKSGISGRVCEVNWDDTDAGVVCRQLGMAGGVSYQFNTRAFGPFLLSEVNCFGNETSLFNCATGSEVCTSRNYAGFDAGVLCYRNNPTRLELVGGTAMSGRVEIIYEGVRGTVCYSYRSPYVPQAVCRQLGFNDGIASRSFGPGSGQVYLSDPYCYGIESSVFQCVNNKFGATTTRCQNHANDLGVQCYGNVKLVRGTTNVNASTGIVQFYKDSSWRIICGSGFDNYDATVVCRELGYPYGFALPRGTFGTQYYTAAISYLNCTGSETTVANCGFRVGGCVNSYPYNNYASVICSKQPVTNDFDVVLGTTFPSMVRIQKMGLNATVCNTGWGDEEAGVVCRSKGYVSGVAFGPVGYAYNTPPRLFAASCIGNETRLQDCAVSTRLPYSCTSSYYKAAYVYCYNDNTGVNLRLIKNGQISNSAGRVEVQIGGVWGSVCAYSFSSSSARVVCKSLGYPDGSGKSTSTYGRGTGPVWLYSPTCSGTEKALWNCRSSRFNVTNSYPCNGHRYDVGVQCSGLVRLRPNRQYGAVQVYDGVSSYQMVCADNFNDISAKVVCNQIGYLYGVSVGASAFGRQYYGIGYTNVRCTGRETRFRDCPHDISMTYCPSRKYASAVCSNTNPRSGYTLALQNTYQGRVTIGHMGISGYICPDGFDDREAMVICREKGYTGGFAYTYYNRYYSFYTISTVRWLSNINCDGSETYLSNCAGVRFGDTANCSSQGDAAVYCYQTSGLQVRLGNKTGSAGRVELSVDGSWGTMCTLYSGWYMDKNADVLCRMLNYTTGRHMGLGTFGPGSGTIYLSRLNCKGTERSISECASQWRQSYFGCSNHKKDNAIMCFDNVRVMGSSTVNYGRVEVYRNNQWSPVCDHNFDNTAARVVCRKLGYTDGKSQCCNAVGDVDASTITVTVNGCTGTESDLLSCNLAFGTCTTGKYATVYCSYNNIRRNDAAVRLQASSRDYGSIQVNRYGFWGPVCNVGWNNKDADVACRSMGFVGGVTFSGQIYSSTPMLVGKFNCQGGETNLTSCPFSDLDDKVDLGCNSPPGRSRQSAGVLCYNNENGASVRLADGGSNYGRVEVNYNGVWGRVCGWYWGDVDAKIACRQLGFLDGSALPVAENNNTKVWMNYVSCSGSEASLFECPKYWNYRWGCSRDAGVVCYNKIRLMRGNQFSVGVVEVNTNNNWGSICSNGWSDTDVSVACKELGYQNGFNLCCGVYGSRSYSVMENVQCTGSENNLVTCHHDVPTSRYCRGPDASVACYNGTAATAFTWSLADGNNYTGEVIVNYMNMVGRICTDDWDDKDATVACRELGYSKGYAYTHYKYSFNADNGPFWTSKMNCAGTENRLVDCSRTQLGKVASCQNSHSAGVLCGDNVGIYYSLSNGGPENAGRVQVSVNGVLGSVCRSYFDSREATVMCRGLGYNVGLVDYYTKYPNASGPVYESRFRCTGNEGSLAECPHEGWKVATSRYCMNHNYDAAITCYGDIKLASGFSPDIKQGPVQVWRNNTWHYVCDTNFDDLTAKTVCRSLGFVDGKALCCSAYGSKYVRYSWYGNGPGSFLPNITMNCDGTKSDPMTCLTPGTCSNDYASVVCFNTSDAVEETYTLGFDDSTSDSGQIAVQHYDTKGRICNTFWTDTEAAVFCKGLHYDNGIAYHHSVKYNYHPIRSRGPFWLSAVNCTGSETSLTDCAYNDRKSLGNCSSADIASAICFNGDKSIQYRMVAPDGTQHNYGRVEMSVGGVWGTVCDRYFDNREAGVFCRQMGYKDGYAIPNAFYGQGSGPMWLSGLQCDGSEPSLHSCPHSGFNSEVVSGFSFWSCQSHRDDVSVLCVDNVRVNSGLNASMGAVEVYANNKWNAVCDSGFDANAARVTCRTMGFNFGINIGGSLFGITDGPIGISQVTCNGREANFKQCSTTASTTCKSGTYASVVCSNDPITDSGFMSRLVADDLVADTHGFLEVNINGIWGSVCASGFDDRAANVACKQLSFKGGVAYSPAIYNPFHSTGQHIISETRPILMTEVVCNGNEDSLAKCAYKARSTTKWCDYYAPRAGLLCYRNAGVQYRLAGQAGGNPLQGRVEMKYDNQWGTICDASVSSNTAKVACKSLGHADGLPVTSARYMVANDNRPIWFHYFKCYGNETTLPTCMNDGFYSTLSIYRLFWSSYCKRIGPASATCYNKEIKVTNVRLVDGPTNNTGRVEVYLQGPDQWGTVCDDVWDDQDATVVCMMFGFAKGKAMKKAFYGQGKGQVWMDNVGCKGNEAHIQDCSFNGFAIHNCAHSEDAGVQCSGVLPTTTATGPTGGPVTQKISSNAPPAAAIAVPIVCALLIAAAVCGFLYYRRRYKNKDTLTQGLVPDTQATSRGGLGVSLGGASAFFSKSVNGGDVSGVSNPNYDNASPIEASISHVDDSASKVKSATVDGEYTFDEMDHHLSLVLALAIVVGVNAQRPSTILVRIVGTSATYGRVEVRNNATSPWGTVCSDYWGNKDATVTCRMLGYRWGTAFRYFGGGSGMIYMDNVQCTGNENTLASCRYSGWTIHNCNHYEDAGVACSNDNFRLVGTAQYTQRQRTSSSFGAVEYRDPTGWKPVCDSGWDDRDALVLCRSLGYQDGSALCCNQLSPYTSNPYLDTRRSRTNFSCSGNEASIFNCTNQLRTYGCSYKRIASAICYSQLKSQVEMGFSLRLANGTDVSGQVEVTRLGVAGKICASNWNVNASNVVCKQLGFRGGVTFGTTSTRTDLPVWITSVNCTGQETSLDQCVSSVWGVPRGYCNPANVLCYNTGPPQLSLAGGDSSHGRVEITIDGETGTVCDNSFSNGDARVVCQMLGFKDGNYLAGSYYGRGSGPIFMDRLNCGGYEQTLWSCRNRGWRNPEPSCGNHSKDASVTCFNEIRLSGGDHGHGVVLVWNNVGRYSRFQALCGTGFDNTAAKVVCRELGFQNGRSLPRGSYGTYYYSTYLGSNITCTGNEASIRNCTLGSGTCSRQGYTGYASVSCYNGTLNTDSAVKLSGGPDPYSAVTGHVAVTKSGISGRVCEVNWDDTDAGVVCRQLGMAGGVSYQFNTRAFGPFLLSEVNCFGNETSLFNCATGSEVCTSRNYAGFDAGVLCYRNNPIRVELVGGTAMSGRVEIIYEGVRGTVCNSYGYSSAPKAVCQQLGFNDGISSSSFGPGSGQVFMSNPYCFGYETSIFQCSNAGLGSTTPTCQNHANDLGVQCYGNVKLVRGTTNVNASTGIVQFYKDSSWRIICGSGFDNYDATVVCRELGYPYGFALPRGTFGTQYYTAAISYLNCTGSETTVANCGFRVGGCVNRYPYNNYASVICSKQPVTNDFDVVLGTTFPTMVRIQKMGITATVCNNGWGDEEAGVVCRSKGYVSGVAFGAVGYAYNTPPRLLVTSCIGNETRLQDCTLSTNLPSSCTSSYYKAAYVYCYNDNTGVNLRLIKNGQISNSAGRVEVQIGGVWGSVCAYSFSSSSARVVCKSLGYPDGSGKSTSTYGRGTGPVWIYSPTCSGTEKALWNCRSSRFNVTNSYPCNGHRYDVGVQCSGLVRLQPNRQYGAVQVYDGVSSYQTVCADNFNDISAKVVCNQIGYLYGVSVGASAFGRQYYGIGYTNIRCTGRETRFRDCPHDISMTYCPSRKYASAVCSNTNPRSGYTLALQNTYQGRVTIGHMGISGYICPDGFDDREAMVICREKGYTGGFAYTYYNRYYSFYTISTVRWLSNINCDGSETYLSNCAGVRFGDTANCSSQGDAAVYCYQTSGLQVRLGNKTGSAGRVELSVDGSWGTMCTLYSGWYMDKNADVLCRMLNYTTGRHMGLGTFGPGSGTIYLSRLNCKGTERSISECASQWRQSYFGCSNHQKDNAIMCYDNVRLMGSSTVNYGRVEVYRNNQWSPVCDHNFDNTAARVVCRKLGYTDGKSQCCNAVGDVDASTITVTVNGCTGTESDLLSCNLAFGTCTTGKYATVYCSYNNIRRNDAAVRLQYSSRDYGSIEVNRYGFWGPVCNVGWNNKDADVACRSMGFVGGVTFSGQIYSSTPMLVGKFNCQGGETNLTSCPFSDLDDKVDLGCNSPPGRSRKSAGVLCYNNENGASVRLADGGSNYGRVEVNYNGVWGRVCGWYWSDVDAKIACRQLGFLDGSARPVTENNNTKVWMNYVSCSGSEASLFECPKYWNYRWGCSRDAGVVCYDTIRLTRGNQVSVGVVEVNFNNNWGSICSTGWSDTDVSVACKQLGYQNGFNLCCGVYGSRSYAVLDNVQCTGSENKLVACPHDPPSSRYCSGSDASVACYNGTAATAFTWSLADGNNYTGEVIVNYMNMVGRICTDDWDDKDATVACRELGYSKGYAYTHYKYSFYADNGPFWTSKMNCAGTENRLVDCSRTQLGKVTSCQNSHSAGVLCGDNVGIYYSLSNGGPENAGRVEVSVNGVLGSVCRSYFDSREATVMCRGLGYNVGLVDYYTKYPNASGPVYESRFQCTGNEGSLAECPHEGWKVATSRYCMNHNYDAAITCYGDIKLASGFSPDIKQGPVQVWRNNTWHYVCDTNFDDLTAKTVCRSLGFVDGKALCCSAYGSKYVRYSWYGNGPGSFLPNITMNCDGTKSDPMTCLTPGTCSNDYASVVCFNTSDTVEETYTLGFDDSTSDSGQIAVQHYGTKGRICNTFWTDTEAAVFCKGLHYDNGIAYHHSVKYNYHPIRSRGPFWLSAVNCTGSETSLTDCAYNDRKSLGNCSSADIASAICFNGDKSIQYRMVAPDGTQQNYGRVEMSVGGVWGTVCDRYFDNREAGVFCRQMGYKDGYAIPNAFYGQGSGPMWLSGLQCDGSEPSLHSCPHSGYNSEVVSGFSFWSCQSHRDDVSVFCVDNVRLNTGLNASMGAVEVYSNNKWNAVCDNGFDGNAARVVCRTMGFTFGVNIGGSLFGITEGPIGIGQVACNGREANFKQCSTTASTTCKSGTYASVVCSNDPITDSGFLPRLVADDLVADTHGFLEVNINGIWGSVCASGFDDRAANVACKQLSFKGGVAYSPAIYNPFHSTGQHIISETRPILMTDVVCNGNEDSLAKCAYKARSTTKWCDYYAPRAGLLCYRNAGVQYRLVSAAGDNPLQGRVEMKYDNQWGTICDASVSSNTAKVACKSLGHVDGLPVSSARYMVANDNRPIWFHYFKCYGNETTLPTCMNDGFYSTLSIYRLFWSSYCKRIGPASAKCYNKEIKVTNVRLVDGPTNNTGRVEVYLQGPDQWGTVCDDVWDDQDATVVCMMFGFAKGKAMKKAFYGQGKGQVWMDNIGCKGNEAHIQDCSFNGFAIHNCAHSEDAGVQCSGVLPTTTATGPTGGPVTQKISSNAPPAAAIAVPIVCALLIAAAVCGFLYYRRRYKNKDTLTKGLVPDIPATTSRGGFGVSLGGASAFFSKDADEGDVSGVSNPNYDNVTPDEAKPSHVDASNA